MVTQSAPSTWLQRLSKLHHHVLILSIREGFIALLPLLVIAAIALLLQGLISLLPPMYGQSQVLALLHASKTLILQCFPLAVVISLSYQLAKNLQLHGIACSLLAVICFLTHSNFLRPAESELIISSAGSSGFALVIPLLVPYLVRFFCRRHWLQLINQPLLSPFLQKHLNLILPFFLTYFCCYLLLPLLSALSAVFTDWLLPELAQTSQYTQALIRMAFIHLLWLVGIHGDNTYTSIFSNALMEQTFVAGLTLQSFYNHFVIVGGSGCLLALVLMMLLSKPAAADQKVLQVSLPFSIFNFAEITLYGLPVVFNPVYIVPFLAAPLLNFTLSYELLQSGIFVVQDQQLSWLTPVGISGWLLSGNPWLVVYQLSLVLLNMLIYLPFIHLARRLADSQQPQQQVRKFLSLSHIEQLEAEKRFSLQQQHNHRNQHALQKVLEELQQGKLQLHYQPKIDLELQQVAGFEALIRLETPDGKLQGPWFLDILERNQLCPLIDLWVVQQAHRDLQYAAKLQLHPLISLNIHPASLQEQSLVQALLAIDIEFPQQIHLELLEHAMLDENSTSYAHLKLLQAQGICIAVDDFGRGFSNLSSLIKHRPDIVKLDRSLLLAAAEPNGLLLFSHMAAFCKALNYKLIAEGVETEAELNLVQSQGIRYVQGWYFSKALPWPVALQYQLTGRIDPTAPVKTTPS